MNALIRDKLVGWLAYEQAQLDRLLAEQKVADASVARLAREVPVAAERVRQITEFIATQDATP